jgi:hypothetical protein
LITANVFCRVLFVQVEDMLGTAFTIEVDGRQYLVTASHVATAGTGAGPLRVSNGEELAVVPVVDIAVATSDHIDVAVLAPAVQLTRTLPLPPTMDGLAWGQDVFFLGFPYGLQGEPRMMNEGRPLAFVKRAQFSGEFLEDGGRVMVLDGHNVKGMSGGPIVFKAGNDSRFRVAGIVQSFWQRKRHWLSRSRIGVAAKGDIPGR